MIDAALPVARQLPTVLGGLTPLLDHLRACAPEVVSFFTLFGDATSNYDVNGNMVRVSAILIQQRRGTRTRSAPRATPPARSCGRSTATPGPPRASRGSATGAASSAAASRRAAILDESELEP